MNKYSGCIIVPYRDRAEHLAKFLPHYMGVLPIIVVEQADDKPFNRAKLLNVGFLEEGHKYDYALYHDVDMMSVGFENYTEHWSNAIHFASQCSQFNYQLPYEEYFGGVTYIPEWLMLKVNGFSNNFWGYGGEDDHMFKRLCERYMPPCRIDNVYECFDHERHIEADLHRQNVSLLNSDDDPTDGLTSCQYTVTERTHTTYTHIKAIL